MSIQEQIQNYYSDLWKKELGVSYNEAVVAYSEFNSPGIEPDFIFYYYFIKYFNIQSILEFGSGLSTLFFKLVAKKLNIYFYSFEEVLAYYTKTIQLLARFSIDITPNLYLLDKIPIQYINNCDFLFFDASGGLRKDWLQDSVLLDTIPVIAVDDFDFLQVECANFICRSNRPNFHIYNGTGRVNRLQFINFKDISIESFREFLYNTDEIKV